ncbi:MAG: hypothetical protein H6739_30050 [Alphaproteobacteria bacterium]|nr:hypothetical protein [Alphaproteobacteria bacterium]
MTANTPNDDVTSSRREVLGELAVHAFRMAIRQDPQARDGAVLSEVVLRSGLIHRLGAKSGTIRDPAELWDLLEGVLVQAEPARRHVADGPVELTRVSRDDLLKLRRVKSVLRGAVLALQDLEQEQPVVVGWWWMRRDRLP